MSSIQYIVYIDIWIPLSYFSLLFITIIMEWSSHSQQNGIFTPCRKNNPILTGS